MTVKTDYAEPCWEPIDLDTGIGYHHDEDRWPHYKSRAECAEQIAELHRDRGHYPDEPPLHLVARQCFPTPCVVIVCDGDCGEQFDYEGGGGMHFDPADPFPVPLEDCGWHDVRGKHYCDECVPVFCDDCDERHDDDEPCPDTPTLQPVPISDGQEPLW